ncbi:hypothetical protein [Pseudoalteromonas umbrosa]|uniref:hypothetical protein n=1 Tax=Pseudoalteromonas umbrosa TaxID=3048489 RepID=UPI0024C3E60F|nr:hypothetical protein [Pseudoalteromonas sp. B95]MDK1286363.1 hypothetical protein [Pseudoalteromonas sp. B95]
MKLDSAEIEQIEKISSIDIGNNDAIYRLDSIEKNSSSKITDEVYIPQKDSSDPRYEKLKNNEVINSDAKLIQFELVSEPDNRALKFVLQILV